MTNDQTYLDNGEPREIHVVEFDADGNMSDKEIVIGVAATYAEALAIVIEAGYSVAPEDDGYEMGHIPNADGPDAYAVPVLV